MTVNPLGTNHHPLLFPNQPLPASSLEGPMQFPHLMRAAAEAGGHGLQDLTLKREQQQPPFNLRQEIPAWLGANASLNQLDLPSSIYASRLDQEYSHENHQAPTLTSANGLPHHLIHQPLASAPAHMSATALLQKAAQMGATMSRPSSIHSQMAGHNSSSINAHASVASSGAGVFGLGLSTSHHNENNGANGSTAGPSPLLHDLMINSLPQATTGFELRSFEEHYGGGGGNDGMTRDFLGLRALSHKDLLNLAGLETCMSTSSSYEHQNKKPWHGN